MDQWFQLCQTRFIHSIEYISNLWWSTPHPWRATAYDTIYATLWCQHATIYGGNAMPNSFWVASCPLLRTLNLASIFAANICDLITLCNSGDQDETQWGQTTTIHVVPLEHSLFLSPPNDGKTVSSK